MTDPLDTQSPAKADAPNPLLIRDCWNARGKGAFWVTQYMGYTIGSGLAPLCNRAGISPNSVTVMGFLTAALAVVPLALGSFSEPVTAGCYLAVMLMLSFGMDCADGILARMTGKCSPFGMLWDKLVDLLSLYIIAMGLGLAAWDSPPGIPLISENWGFAFPLLLVWSMAPKSIFSVFGWLKDLQVNQMSRTGAARKLSLAGYVKRIAGNMVDEPVFRLGLGVAWGLEVYWEYVLGYHGVVAVMLVAYVAITWRNMAGSPASA